MIELRNITNQQCWAFFIFLSILIIVAGLIIIQSNPFVLRLEMDNNTLKAVQSINWSVLP